MQLFGHMSRQLSSLLPLTHLQETVISTLVAGMLPVNGSKSYTDDISSNLSITSPSIISMAKAPGGTGLIQEAHSLAPTPRPESPLTPQSRSQISGLSVRPGEAAVLEMFHLETNEKGALC